MGSTGSALDSFMARLDSGSMFSPASDAGHEQEGDAELGSTRHTDPKPWVQGSVMRSASPLPRAASQRTASRTASPARPGSSYSPARGRDLRAQVHLLPLLSCTGASCQELQLLGAAAQCAHVSRALLLLACTGQRPEAKVWTVPLLCVCAHCKGLRLLGTAACCPCPSPSDTHAVLSSRPWPCTVAWQVVVKECCCTSCSLHSLPICCWRLCRGSQQMQSGCGGQCRRLASHQASARTAHGRPMHCKATRSACLPSALQLTAVLPCSCQALAPGACLWCCIFQPK